MHRRRPGRRHVDRDGVAVGSVIMQLARSAPSPHPNSGLPEFGTIERSKSDKSDFDWGEGWGEGGRLSRQSCIPLTPTLSPNGEREPTEFAETSLARTAVGAVIVQRVRCAPSSRR